MRVEKQGVCKRKRHATSLPSLWKHASSTLLKSVEFHSLGPGGTTAPPPKGCADGG